MVTVLVSLVLPACVIHPTTVRLAVPQPTAAPSERIAAFERLRPESVAVTEVVRLDRMVGRRTRYIGELRLADGTLVIEPEMLLSAVDEGSDTQQSIVRYEKYRRRAHRTLWIGRALGFAAIGLFAGAFAFDAPERRYPLFASLGLALGWVSSRFALRRSTRQREAAVEAAYRSYDADLATHLRLCIDENDRPRSCP